MTYTALLIDDEPLAIRRLRALLKKHAGTIQIIGEAPDTATALAIIKNEKPDILFLDIHLPGMNGFGLLEQLEVLPMIVFVTAYDEYAIKAFEENSLDYILKPVEEERLAKTIKKIKNLQEFAKLSLHELQHIMKNLHPAKEIFSLSVKVGNKFIVIPLKTVSHFEAKERYVFLYTLSQQKFIINLTMSKLEEKLPEYFIRISRSIIINYHQVKEIHRDSSGRMVITMLDDKRSKVLSVGNYQDNLKKFMQLNG